jgi:hypothetical protein
MVVGQLLGSEVALEQPLLELVLELGLVLLGLLLRLRLGLLLELLLGLLLVQVMGEMLMEE